MSRTVKIGFVTSATEKLKDFCRASAPGITLEVQQLILDVPEIQDLNPSVVAASKIVSAFTKIVEEFSQAGRSLELDYIVVEDAAVDIEGFNNYPGALVKYALDGMGPGGFQRAYLDKKFTWKIALAVMDLHARDVEPISMWMAEDIYTVSDRPQGLGYGFDDWALKTQGGKTVSITDMKKDGTFHSPLTEAANQFLRTVPTTEPLRDSQE